jgi:hypothetical protein
MKEIKWVGKQVFDGEEELEEGLVEMVINVSEFLDEVDTEALKDYVEYHLDLIHPDDCECESVEDASNYDLVYELKHRRDFSFLGEIEEDEMIDYLIESGYTVTDDSNYLQDSLDYVHQGMLDEIVKKFLESSWEERDSMYKKLGL